jgi:hypothetical protein
VKPSHVGHISAGILLKTEHKLIHKMIIINTQIIVVVIVTCLAAHMKRKHSQEFNLIFVLFSQACGTHGRGEKRVQGFGGKARRKKTT